jgi:ribosomal protein S12 methylthiotransferase
MEWMNRMPIKVSMISLGCPKNQVDAEVMLAKLHAAGFKLTEHVGLSDVVIINTCGFIEDAKKESIENILEMAQLKKEGSIKGIVVSGCLSQRYFKDMQEEFPEVNCILQVGCAGEITKAVRAAYAGEKLTLQAKPEQLEMGGERIVATLPFYAYLKIAEGCDNRCSYCVIPSLRGRYRSRPIEGLVEEAKKLVAGGVRELVLVAQDTTRYGQDLYGKLMLPELLRQLCGIEGLKWIRLLYCYPDYITDELIKTIAKEEKIVKYIDLPIQHVNARIVAAMNRHMAKPALTTLVEKLRAGIPGLTLRTTLIVGFPGETQDEFAELVEFVKTVKFERLGAFAYSQEEGTPAAELDGQLDDEEKQHRQDIVMTEQQTIADEYNQAMQGKTVEVLTEGFDRLADCYFGRSACDAPDIDGKIFFKSAKKLRPGGFVHVLINDIYDYDLFGDAQ